MGYWPGMMMTLAIFAGGGLGAALRHGVNVLCAKAFGLAFPFGTITVNVLGSALMGALIGWLALRSDASPLLRGFAATGILGGFTTFSAFSLDILVLFERGEVPMATLYAAATLIGSIAAVFAGLWFVRAVAS